MIHTAVIIGGGNVAFHLAKNIAAVPSLALLGLYNRSTLSAHFDTIDTFKTTNIAQLPLADIYIIAVKDAAIAEVSHLLPLEGKLVVHTSGNTDMLALDSKNRRGVVYPVQSFSKAHDSLSFAQVPFCIEAEKPTDAVALVSFVKKLSSKVYELNSLQRRYLHVSAVFTNNFVNHLWYLAENICTEQGIPYEILHPLLDETYYKTKNLSFKGAQTGPAMRKDTPTIEQHLSLLSDREKAIYEHITQSIIQTYGTN